MYITLNGQNIQIEQGINLEECLIKQGLDTSTVVVEHNKTIVPAQNFATTILEDEDILEVLHFVGGG